MPLVQKAWFVGLIKFLIKLLSLNGRHKHFLWVPSKYQRACLAIVQAHLCATLM